VWDYRNRLKTVESYAAYGGSVTKQVDYAYDAGNQLVKRVVDPDGGTGSAAIDQTFYLYDQGQVTLEFHKTGSGSATASHLSHRYLWNPAAVDQLLTDEQVHDLYDSEENETLWALTDRLGSVTDMVDYLGTHRLHRAFDSFGNVTNETHYDADGIEVTAGWPGYVDMAFAYTGRFYDKTTGLQNNLNRWYDASTGRWLSEDPISFAAGDVNLYRYVGNGPVNGTDPSGLYLWGIGTPNLGGGPPNFPGHSYNPRPEPEPGPPAKPAPPNLYCYYLTPGNSAPADPWYLNWGSEAGFGTGALAGASALGAAAWGAAGGGQFAIGVSGGGGSLGGGGFHITFGYGSGGAYTWAHGTFGGVTTWGAGPGAVNLTGIPIFAPGAVGAWAATRPEAKNCATAAAQAFWQGLGLGQ
jgi:RHS repeat-associated protein